MTDPSVALLDYLRKVGLGLEPDFLREAIRVMSELLMEVEVSQQAGAGRYERSEQRMAYRNGYRERTWSTRVGDIALRIPKLREGSYFPSLLEPRRQAERALVAVVQQAYVQGVSTRKVDELLRALGLTGIDKSAVSRLCRELDEVVARFRQRPLEAAYPYVWLDALYLKVRQNHRIVSQAVVIAVGVRETGERDVLGFAVGASEEEAFWRDFLRGLVGRGLHGVQLVISDAHEGLKAAIAAVFAGASWQRCRVHFLRNLLARVPQRDKAVVAALARTIFAQPDRQAAGQQLREVARLLEGRWPQAAELLLAAEDDVLAYLAFPREHWTRLYSTNLLERLNREVKRRTDVVGVFPDVPAVYRLVGAVLLELDDEWQVERRYFSLDSMRKLAAPDHQREEGPSAAPRLAPVR
ncbi:MAG TPA: IS256 family transposase [Longimicrobiales bacterium]